MTELSFRVEREVGAVSSASRFEYSTRIIPLSIYFNKYFVCDFFRFAELFLRFLPIIYNDVRAYMVNIGRAEVSFGKIVQR
jgi:hypothetical protein